MDKFTNLEFHSEPETTLFTQEIDVIQTVIDSVLTSFVTYPDKGTFILDGQAKGQQAQCILRFDLAAGISRRNFFRTYDRTSSEIAADSIDNALSWPKNSRYECASYEQGSPLTASLSRNDIAVRYGGLMGAVRTFGWLPSGIYRDGELEVLVLNTTHGRFLASFCAEFDLQLSKGEETTSILIAVATAIANMSKEDTTLQRSATYIKEQATAFERNAIWLVDSLFGSCASSNLKAWKKWHEPANNSGKLTLFFE